MGWQSVALRLIAFGRLAAVPAVPGPPIPGTWQVPPTLVGAWEVPGDTTQGQWRPEPPLTGTWSDL